MTAVSGVEKENTGASTDSHPSTAEGKTVACTSACASHPEANVERKVPLLAKVLVALAILISLGFFLAFASSVSSGAMD